MTLIRNYFSESDFCNSDNTGIQTLTCMTDPLLCQESLTQSDEDEITLVHDPLQYVPPATVEIDITSTCSSTTSDTCDFSEYTQETYLIYPFKHTHTHDVSLYFFRRSVAIIYLELNMLI